MFNAHNLPDAQIQLSPNFLSEHAATTLQGKLLAEIAWRQDAVQLFGKTHAIPRLHQWFGDPGARYRWSGITMEPLPWTSDLAELRDKLQQTTGYPFNAVLANYYRNGKDSMGWHADDEAELGDSPVIASISLGAARELLLRPRQRSKGTASHAILLNHGSLLLMSGQTQKFWEHSLPKRTKISTARINLTFRAVNHESI